MSNPVDTERLGARIAEMLEAQLQYEAAQLVARLLKLKSCESPIEASLAVAMDMYDRVVSGMPRLIICGEVDIAHYGPTARLLVTQYHFDNYRIDFAFIDPPHTLFIECDGHAFHERTKEQAARDRQKDRRIQQAGIPILRFTGSEIYADPVHCAMQVFDFMGDMFAAEFQRSGHA